MVVDWEHYCYQKLELVEVPLMGYQEEMVMENLKYPKW